jgi:hypothetical protein
MADDGDPGPAGVEAHAAFYGLWPRFADPPDGDPEQAGDGRTLEPVARPED